MCAFLCFSLWTSIFYLWPFALVCFSPSALRWFFASCWFLLHKATVSGTATTCLCARPTAAGTAGPPETAAAVQRRTTERTWAGRRHRRQTPSITSTDMGRPQRNHEGKMDTLGTLSKIVSISPVDQNFTKLIHLAAKTKSKNKNENICIKRELLVTSIPLQLRYLNLPWSR